MSGYSGRKAVYWLFCKFELNRLKVLTTNLWLLYNFAHFCSFAISMLFNVVLLPAALRLRSAAIELRRLVLWENGWIETYYNDHRLALWLTSRFEKESTEHGLKSGNRSRHHDKSVKTSRQISHDNHDKSVRTSRQNVQRQMAVDEKFTSEH